MPGGVPPPPRTGPALEAAANAIRDAQSSDRDEILEAQRALRQAEKAHDRAIDEARRDLAAARSLRPLVAFGHRLMLYEDRLSTPAGNRPLSPDVTATVTAGGARRRGLELVVEGPGWREVVHCGGRYEKAHELARAVERTARDAPALQQRRRAEIEAAERRLALAIADRRGVEQARPLLRRLAALLEDDEDALDMTPGVCAGHDGVVVATDRRLLFIAPRRRSAVRYAEVSWLSVRGRWFGTRLTLSTAGGKTAISGLAPRRARQIGELIRERSRATA
jgi:Bacterial PH domain